MSTRPRVTFVGHDASRTGAPLVLLTFLRWLLPGAQADVDLVLRRGGSLLPAYRSVVPTTLLDGPVVRGVTRAAEGFGAVLPGRRGTWSHAEGAVLRRSAHHARRSAPSGPEPEVVVANTLAALGTAAAITPGSARLVCHVHELDHVAHRLLRRPGDGEERPSGALLDRVDHFVATGEAVATMLVSRFGVPEGRVSVVDAFIERPLAQPAAVEAARVHLADRGGGPVVMSVGATGRRKGPDRFVDLLTVLAGHPSSPTGVWLGGDPTDVVWAETMADIRRAEPPGAVRMIPAVANPLPYIAAADVVVSTAREDPYPLALLEAAALGVPIVSFDSGGAGGMLRAAGQHAAVIPMGDLLCMASVVADLIDDPARAAAASEALSRHVERTHLVEHLAPALWQAIQG